MNADEVAKVANAFQPLLMQQVTPESIYFGVGNFDGTMTTRELFGNIPRAAAAADILLKSWTWGLLSSGDCASSDSRLVINSDGGSYFSCSLTSSDLGDDSWGILHFDFYQNNGVLLWTSGQFWSPTIVSVGQRFEFGFGFPKYLFNDIAGVWMTYHC
jgi:hypothetical protein